jgi:gliding motility-associated lipoprotein GldH
MKSGFKKTTSFIFGWLLLSLLHSSCTRIDLFERVKNIPSQQWSSSFKPQFRFTITDTVATYQLYILLRHTNKYNYNNIWLNLHAKAPGQKPQRFTLELPLATNEKGWLGSGMDDLFDHRIAVTLDPQKFNFSKPGEYIFTLEHVMREEPLQHVMNAGIRLEKK